MQIVNKEMKTYEIVYSSASTNFVEAYYIKAVNLYEALTSFMRSKIPVSYTHLTLPTISDV